MNSRERVEKCLRRQAPDRVPIDFWAVPEVERKLMKRFGFSHIEQVLQYFDVDFRHIEGPKYVGPKFAERSDGAVEDHFGVPRRPVSHDGGTYNEVVCYPLEKAASVDEVESYPKWPQPDWFDYECARAQAGQARENGKVVVFMGDRLNRCAQLKPAMYLRGVEQIFVDLAANPEIARAIFRRIADFYAEYAKRTLEAGDGNIDIFFTGDDFGTQDNTFMSPGMWRDFLKDGFKRFIEIGHAFRCKVAHHTCGCIAPLIPDFVECGLDILNPMQPEAAGMDYEGIKQKFGAELTFHGGISIQKTMPYGTPADIYAEARHCREKLGAGGGYIFCTAHNIQSDTPMENIEALFAAYKELGRY